VTNAEFACFMEAGGYGDEKYWVGELANRWLKGEDVSGGQNKTILDNWRLLKDNPGWQEKLKDATTPDQIEAWESLLVLTEEQVKEKIAKEYSQKSRSQPQYWKDRDRNNPSQPVVGITWFEAKAYCAWLSEVTGTLYCLPSEVEWEAAARGAGKTSRYPWGNDWDKEKANSLEGRVLKTSPVGAYYAAGAVGPFGAEDQAGNVYDWTSSSYFPYPYDVEKCEVSEAVGERITRGGSWSDDHRNVRCADRFWDLPGSLRLQRRVSISFPWL
jgi:formylglycine-generating enzyme required for sulfatase activity